MKNIPDEFWERLKQHFTGPELADFLALDVEDIIDRFEYQIGRAYKDLCDEIYFEIPELEVDEDG